LASLARSGQARVLPLLRGSIRTTNYEAPITNALGQPVHMNGRIYDPLLGRFLSADRIIDGPFNLQGYNRYSYVKNNPLSATDPTGYAAVVIAIPVTITAMDVAWSALAAYLVYQGTQGDLDETLGRIQAAQQQTSEQQLESNAITVTPQSEIDITDPGIQMDGEASRPVVQADPIPTNPIQQEAITGTEAADVVASESIEAQGLTGPVVHSTPAAQDVELPTTYSATNGNSKQSTKEQHGYGIRRNGEMVKAGISGQGLNQNGTSPRANRQVNALNKAAGAEIHESEILFGVAAGTGAREAALEAERQVADQNRETLDPKLHKRP